MNELPLVDASAEVSLRRREAGHKVVNGFYRSRRAPSTVKHDKERPSGAPVTGPPSGNPGLTCGPQRDRTLSTCTNEDPNRDIGVEVPLGPAPPEGRAEEATTRAHSSIRTTVTAQKALPWGCRDPLCEGLFAGNFEPSPDGNRMKGLSLASRASVAVTPTAAIRGSTLRSPQPRLPQTSKEPG